MTTTELSDDDILARLDVAEINHAAEWAASRLGGHDCALIDLAPGDATRYEIIVVAPQPFSNGRHESFRDEYRVVLVNCNGVAYPWSGQEVHPSYATQKWTTDHCRWTGVVVAAFLNALAARLESPS